MKKFALMLASALLVLSAASAMAAVPSKTTTDVTHEMCIRDRYTYVGLVLFLCGVNVGFGPVGTVLGRSLAQPGYKWLLVPIGMLIGFFIVKAEPAIQVLNRQIQSVTSGAISARAMNRCLSIGVSVSVGLAMLRV